jgi:hypothetical protein
MTDCSQHETTSDPLIADKRNFYKVEKWTKDGSAVDSLLFAGSNLDKARKVFQEEIKHGPRIRLRAGVEGARSVAANQVAAVSRRRNQQRQSSVLASLADGFCSTRRRSILSAISSYLSASRSLVAQVSLCFISFGDRAHCRAGTIAPIPHQAVGRRQRHFTSLHREGGLTVVRVRRNAAGSSDSIGLRPEAEQGPFHTVDSRELPTRFAVVSLLRWSVCCLRYALTGRAF